MKSTTTRTASKGGILASLLLVLALLLSACGATVDTNLSFSKDGKGTRTIVATLDTENLSEHAKGGLKAITASLKKHTPKQLTFKGVKENKSDHEAVATFTMSFDSFEDYEKKVNELLLAGGSEKAAEINTVIENNEFVNGFATEENFTSADLLAWTKDGLIADGVIAESDASKVLNDGDAEVKFEGKKYDSSARINVDKVKDNGFDVINVNTVLNPDGTFTQEIIYQIDTEKAKKLGEKLTTFLAKATVEDELEDYYGQGSKTGYSQKFTAADVNELSTKTGKALGSEKVSYEFTNEPSSEVPTNVVASLKASLDCDTICSPSGKRVVSEVSYPSEYSYLTGTQSYPGTGDNGELLIHPEGANFTVKAEKSVPFESAHVRTEVGFDRSVSQEYTFSATKDSAELVGDAFETLLTPGEQIGSLETKEADNAVQYLVKISGDSAEDLNSKLQNYAAGATISTMYEEGFAFWPDYFVSFGWDPSGQLNNATFTNGARAEVQLPFAHKFAEDSINSTSVQVDGGTLNLSSENYLDANMSASGPTMASFVVLGIIVFLILLGLALLFIFRKRIGTAGKKAWDQRDEAIAAGRKAASGVAAAGAAAAAGVGASVASANASGSAALTQSELSGEFTEADLI